MGDDKLITIAIYTYEKGSDYKRHSGERGYPGGYPKRKSDTAGNIVRRTRKNQRTGFTACSSNFRTIFAFR